MSDPELEKNQISNLNPTIIVNENGDIIYFNETAKNRWKLPNSNTSEQLDELIKNSTHLLPTKLKNMFMQKDRSDLPCQVLPLIPSQKTQKQLYLVSFNSNHTIERYLHFLESIHKISSRSYRYKKVYSLASFVVNELYTEEYKFFHVGLFLKDFSTIESHVKLIAIAGESRELFKEYCDQKYIQSTEIGVIGKVFSSGKTMIIQDTSAIDYYHATPYFRGKSEICVPIIISDEIVGVLNIESRDNVDFDHADALFLESIADLFAANLSRINTTEEIFRKNKKLRKYLQDLTIAKEALELQSVDLKKSLLKGNKVQKLIRKQNELMQSKLEMGAELQKSLLPKTLPKLRGIRISSQYHPNYHLGGDFFDVCTVDDRHAAILIADVSGHGVSAAMIAAMFKAFFNNYRRSSISPAKIMKHLNKEFCSIISTGDYITSFLLILDMKNYQIRYCNAGHPFPFLYKGSTKSVQELDSEGFFIGIFDGQEFEEKSTQLDPGDKILFYTDGAIEIKNENDKLFGRKNLKNHFKRSTEKGSKDKCILGFIFKHLQKYARNSTFDDDLTLLLVERCEQ